MSERDLIERAKRNMVCLDGLDRDDPELAAFLLERWEDVGVYCGDKCPCVDTGRLSVRSGINVYRLRPDYEPEPDRWWFHPRVGKVSRHGPAPWGDGGGWLEVTPEYAAYLRNKPGEGWELRKQRSGDTVIAWNGEKAGGECSVGHDWHPDRPDDRGYRWCRIEKEEAPASPEVKDPDVFIKLSGAEVQSSMNRVKWAELLIEQLPPNHEGRNSWLINFGRRGDAINIRARHNDGRVARGMKLLGWIDETQCLETRKGGE